MLASNGNHNTIRVSDVATGQPVAPDFEGHTFPVRHAAFSPDSKTVASASDDRTIRLWDVAGGRPIGGPLEGHTHPVTFVAFSSDGQTLASTSMDGTIRLWDVDSRRLIGQLRNSRSPSEIAFSHDGRLLASADTFRQPVRLWEGGVETWRARACSMAGRNLTTDEWRQYLRTQPYRNTCPHHPEPEP